MPPSSSQIAKARMLRRWMPEPDMMLWQALRNRRLDGWKFRRRAPVGDRVVEFLCVEARLVVEITGKGQHRRILAERDMALVRQGYGVVRLTREAVLSDLDGVLRRIAGALRARR